MKSETSRRAVPVAVTLALGLAALGCGASPRKEATSPSDMPLPEQNAPARADSHRDARGARMTTSRPRRAAQRNDFAACEPVGKAVVVVERDAEGRPVRWRYFATRHGRRALTCEAADANGDGKIDARYFYDSSGRLVLEQRDLDFDGRAEVVADYSQFQPRRRLVRAHAMR